MRDAVRARRDLYLLRHHYISLYIQYVSALSLVSKIHYNWLDLDVVRRYSNLYRGRGRRTKFSGSVTALAAILTLIVQTGACKQPSSSSPSDVGRRRECGTGRPEVPRSIDVFVEVCDDGLTVEGGVRVPLVGTPLPLPERRDVKIDLELDCFLRI